MSEDNILYPALNTPYFEPNLVPGDMENQGSSSSNAEVGNQYNAGQNKTDDQNHSLSAKVDDTDEQSDEDTKPLREKPKRKKQEKRHYCTEEGCTYSSASPERLSRHQRRHRGLQPYACMMCDYSTVNSQMIREHMFRHTGEKPYKCSHCDHRSNSKKNLKLHESKHDPSNPNRCPCGFIGRGMASVRHARICTTINTTLMLKQLKCKVCDYETTDDREFDKHKKTHRLKCDKCGYTTLEIAKMRAHRPSCTGDTPSTGKKFRCKVCAWSSKLPQKILLHLIHHPKQEVDESIVDISVLRTCGIME